MRFHQQQKIIGPAHEIDRFDLVETVDALGDGVKALVALRGDTHLDHGLHALAVRLVPVDDGRVAQDDAAALHVVDHGRYGLNGGAGHHCQFLQGQAAILLKQM